MQETRILVRVRPGCRVFELGGTYVENQTLWVPKERLPDLQDSIDVVQGVKPIVANTTMMDQPKPAFIPDGLPAVDPELLTAPRTPAPLLRQTKKTAKKVTKKVVAKTATKKKKG
jgi:hypothetical protein